MTSSRLFFKAMREDLRHKIWMIVLFSLVSFLAVPMVWLLIRSNMSVNWRDAFYYSDKVIKEEIDSVLDFCRYYLLTMGGMVGIMAGLVTGLSGFRYLFHKNRVDVYHSLPVKRGTLYHVCYVNGILVWLVPFTVSVMLTMVFVGGFVGKLGGTEAVVRMCGFTGRSLLMILTVFLLVYHVVLIAIMMSGNILNTLVNMLFMGFGVIVVYFMVRVFFEYYMVTYYNRSFPHEEIMIYASPFFNVFHFLFSVYESDGTWNLWLAILINMIVTAVLGVCGRVMYQRRDSELAEQGVRCRAVAAVLRVVMGMAAGMAGWLLFLLVTDNIGGIVGAAWKSFGAILLSVFMFGVLDVIFHMEFGAFFAHKLQMAGTVALTLVICFAFCCDWFGYDTYLPEKDEIAYIAVYDRQFTNDYSGYSEASEKVLEQMQFQDADIIYAFLESAANVESGSSAGRGIGAAGNETVDTRVTLKSGRSYYRSYTVPADKELLWPLFTSEEYLAAAYRISDEEIKGLQKVILNREGRLLSAENAELVADLVRAYHQDLREHAEEMLSGEGQLLVRVRLEGVDSKYGSEEQKEYVLDVYSVMEHMTEVLEQAGYEEWVKPRNISSIAAVRLGLYVSLSGEETREDIVDMAMKLYGVEAVPETDEQGVEEPDSVSGEMYDVPALAWNSESGTAPMLQITDRAEIEELLPYINYVNIGNGSKLKRQHVRAVLVDMQGNTSECCIPKGVLPGKYILRFADMIQKYVGIEE